MADNKLAGWLLAANRSCHEGNLALAELICRHILETVGSQLDALALLGLIALKVRMYDFAIDNLGKALKLDKNNVLARKYLRIAHEQSISQEHKSVRGQTRYLLIKAWGCGFWSDMDHVMGQLLLAELTGRIPVVHWGGNSRFSDNSDRNAFEEFFQPVSNISLPELQKESATYYPPKWTRNNLADGALNQWNGCHSRVAGLYLLNRPESVVISDFHTPVRNLIPWIRTEHPLFGMNRQALYRYLYAKYIKLQPAIEAGIEVFYQQHMKGKSMLGIHVRRSDKVVESSSAGLQEIEKLCLERVDRYLSRSRDAHLFLLTDSTAVLDIYRERYQDRLNYIDCVRTDGDTGIHFLNNASKKRVGIDVVKDVYLAAKCDYFVGNARSNVSTSVLHIKDWSPDKGTLYGDNVLDEENIFIHKR